MARSHRHTACLIAFAVWLAPVSLLASPALTGQWLDGTGRAAIDIEPCGASVCGRIAWLKNPLTPSGGPKTDIHNPKSALQSRKICGLIMLSGFVPDGSGGWQKGQIYDPSSGKTYNSNIHIVGDGTLSVRGYVGIPLFGQSQTWTRPAADLPHCG